MNFKSVFVAGAIVASCLGALKAYFSYHDVMHGSLRDENIEALCQEVEYNPNDCWEIRIDNTATNVYDANNPDSIIGFVHRITCFNKGSGIEKCPNSLAQDIHFMANPKKCIFKL